MSSLIDSTSDKSHSVVHLSNLSFQQQERLLMGFEEDPDEETDKIADYSFVMYHYLSAIRGWSNHAKAL